MKTKYFISLCHSLLLIYVEAICERGESKKNIGVDCNAYWPDGGQIWKGSIGTKTNFPGGRDGKWGGGGGKGGDTKRWVYSERWAKGWWGISGKAGHGWAKGGSGRKKGDRGGKGKNFPPTGRGGGNIIELESPDYEIEDDD
ncbi:eggshell protein-like [Trifolium pratense]|uniref:eggshell protein-like n=1 Tax=Trifolium pratense TaxID=57577 RepID=UPI001E693183|nr:eggshell protein-like [Trifolium pratense]